MKNFILLGLLFLFIISCNNTSLNCVNPKVIKQQTDNTNLFLKKIDSIKKNIPVVDGKNMTFDFYSLSPKRWDWYMIHYFIEIDSIFMKDYIDKPTPLNDSYNKYYQTNYYYKVISMNNNLYNLLILQRIHNDNEAYMYLVQLDSNGERVNLITVASIFKSPIDYEEVTSVINDGIITKYIHYHMEDWDGEIEDKKDTIIISL